MPTASTLGPSVATGASARSIRRSATTAAKSLAVVIARTWGATASSATTPAPLPETVSARMADPVRPIAQPTRREGSMPFATMRPTLKTALCVSSTTDPSPTRTRSFRLTLLHLRALHTHRSRHLRRTPTSRVTTRAPTRGPSAPTAAWARTSSTPCCCPSRTHSTRLAFSSLCATTEPLVTTVAPVRTSLRSTPTFHPTRSTTFATTLCREATLGTEPIVTTVAG